jgi:hypothetical protein
VWGTRQDRLFPQPAKMFSWGANRSAITVLGTYISSPAVVTGRQPLLGTARRRDLFLTGLERVRRRYQFVVAGYVVVPEYIHRLISEPQEKNPPVGRSPQECA